MERVRVAVKDVFGLLNPREEITLEKLSELTLEVRKRVEGATEEERRFAAPSNLYLSILTPYRICKWLSYLLPPQDQEDYVLRESGMTASSESTSPTTTASLRRLIDETSDLIDSPSFTHVLTLLLDAAFSHLVDTKISHLSYKIPPVSESTARVHEIVGSDVKAKVANSLAVFCRQAHNIGTGVNNEYLSAVEQVRDLEAFAAVVYSSNFEFESPEIAAAPIVSRPETAEGQPAAAPVPAPAPPAPMAPAEDSFESAWGKALAKEDGKDFS